jgi:NAD(P)-dependent dehydrogenase (short-subunit alcohol dehydrogenase family)
MASALMMLVSILHFFFHSIRSVLSSESCKFALHCRRRTQMEQKPRLAIVTGSTTGLGLATATSLWRDYNYHVILAVRDEKKALEATKIISGKDSDERLEFIQIDLANLETVNRFAENFYKKYDYLDLLINNAGMVIVQ